MILSLMKWGGVEHCVSATQCGAKVPDGLWNGRKIQRPSEVAFSKVKGKVIQDEMSLVIVCVNEDKVCDAL